jgi:acetolactate synthase-1/2/3 large subunit
VVSGWNAHDVIHNDHPLYVGRPGSVGDRGGNFAVQSADYVLVLGCRLEHPPDQLQLAELCP